MYKEIKVEQYNPERVRFVEKISIIIRKILLNLYILVQFSRENLDKNHILLC